MKFKQGNQQEKSISVSMSKFKKKGKIKRIVEY